MTVQLMMWLTSVGAERGIQNGICLEMQGSSKPLSPANVSTEHIEELLKQLMNESKPLKVTIEEI